MTTKLDSQMTGEEVNRMYYNQQLHSIFGEKSSIVFDTENGQYNINGVFADGVCKGGQHFSVSVKKEDIVLNTGTQLEPVPCWKLYDIEVNGQNFSEYFTSPVLLDVPMVNKNDDIVAEYDYYSMSMLMGYNYVDNVILLASGFKMFDHFVALVHEQNHNIASHHNSIDTNNKLLKISEFLRNFVETSAEIDIDQETLAKMIQETMDKDEFNELKIAAKLKFIDETGANLATSTLLRQLPQEVSRLDNDGFLRLNKFLTMSSLSYGKTINVIFGHDTVDIRQSEISTPSVDN